MVNSNYSKSQPKNKLQLSFPDPERERRLAARAQELITSACIWLAEDVSIVPTQPKSKVCRLPWRDYEDTLADQDTIRRWFGRGNMNMAVVCGSGRGPGGLLVLDFDDRARFEAWQSTAGSLASTYQETTGRGVHLFYKVDQPETRRFSECEALGRGHLCTVAPSIHPTGAVYVSPDPSAPILQVRVAELFPLLSALPLPARSVSIGPSGQDRQARDDLIGKIQRALPVLQLAQTLTELKPSGRDGRWFLGKCPFHEDQEPSFWVDGKRGTWGCYKPGCPGARGGDVINLAALARGVDIREAIKQLAGEVLA